MNAPDGCGYCGRLERDHPQVFDRVNPRGHHGYTAPSNAVRLARMRARRANTIPTTPEEQK